MPHHVIHGEASQGFFLQGNAKSLYLEKEGFNEPCKELKCTCESTSAEVPLLALALSAWQALVENMKHCKSFLRIQDDKCQCHMES